MCFLIARTAERKSLSGTFAHSSFPSRLIARNSDVAYRKRSVRTTIDFFADLPNLGNRREGNKPHLISETRVTLFSCHYHLLYVHSFELVRTIAKLMIAVYVDSAAISVTSAICKTPLFYHDNCRVRFFTVSFSVSSGIGVASSVALPVRLAANVNHVT